MEDFCGSEFWDSELTWNTTTPYFTPCFESTVLSLTPFVFLVIFGLSDVVNIHYSKSKSKTLPSSLTVLGILKALLTITLIVVQLTQFARLELELDDNSTAEPLPVDFLSPALQCLAYSLILIVTLLTPYYMIESSGVQFFFWLLSTITQGILFRTAVANFDKVENGERDEILYLTRLISFPIIFVRFILEFFNTASCKPTRHIKFGKPSPEKSSTFISRLLFLWYDPLAWTGYRRTLTKDDLWNLNLQETSAVQIKKFSEYWAKEVEKVNRQNSKSGKKAEAGVVRPLLNCFGATYGFAIFLKVCSDLLVFVQPTMLSFIVAHVTNQDEDKEPTWKGYFYAAILCSGFIVQLGLNSMSTKKVQLTGMRARAALSNAVFRKALLISSASKREASVGEMVNLQSVDSQKLLEFLPLLCFAFSGPLQIIISVILLYNILGPSVFAGVGILLSLVPLNMYVVTVSRKYQVQQMKIKDRRLKLTSEVINGIKVLKLYAWELAYQAQIEAMRKQELVCIRKIAILNAVTGFIFHCTPVFVTLASFLTYVFSSDDNILNAEKTFVSINLFNIMRLPMIMFPLAFAVGMQTSVSMSRLKKYLNMEELDKTSVTHDESYEDPIVMKNATLSWIPKIVTLKNINFTVKPGELVAVVGTIGSGKTSLLASLLGDLVKQEGVINTKGDIAYVSQSAWIQNETVRNNITFGDMYNEAKYKRTIRACALETDLQILSSGDQTEIGEKGINLSGGQKQRVALARATYKEASVYLFDDPLSAVDSHVGKHIFENLIGANGMLHNKTRILVTHAISFLPQVDRIFVMKNGEISESGTYKELLKKKGEFAEFLLTHLGTESEEEVDADQLTIVQDLEEIVGAETVRRRSTANRESLKKSLLKKQSTKVSDKLDQGKGAEEPVKKLIAEELAAEGNIKMSIFLDYFKAAGIWFSVLSLSLHAGGNALMGWSQIWLSDWSTQATKDELETGSSVQATTDKYALGYGLISASLGIAIFCANLTLALVCLAATSTLFSKALARVIRSPMSYFDTTLLGRIINRFSKDVDTLDNVIPINLRMLVTMFFSVLFAIILICYTTPLFTAFIIPVIILYLFLQRFYVSTSRQLKRLEGVSRSPIFSYFGETISGSSIIRAFQLEDDFIVESERRVDENQKALFPFLFSNAWIQVRLEFIGVLIILSTCVVTLLSRSTIDPGEAGLAITYSLQITSLLSFLARQISDFEANIVSAERIGELTETPQEPAWEKPDNKLSPSWPENGNVVFDNYMTRYREGLDLVLKGISCTIQPGEKIGVVGRTGAGKSSLTLALFRIIESADGKIAIDGIDISSLGLHSLRKKITIIPQDPVLFSGTLRLNLDPFNQYSDDQVWRCLELAHLKPFAVTLKDGLQHTVAEEGQNFSVGQRQLICLARALLRKTKILVLDEATAAVDLETDDLIQATIRKEFVDSTVITIAHRLNTIVDSNRVMVLDKGEIKEFASPQILLADTTSIFWGMAKDAKLV